MFHIGHFHLPYLALPSHKAWHRPNQVHTSNSTLKMDSGLSIPNKNTPPKNSPISSPTDKGKSPERPESLTPNSKPKVTIESADESPSNSIKIKKHRSDAGPKSETTTDNHRGFTGISKMFGEETTPTPTKTAKSPSTSPHGKPVRPPAYSNSAKNVSFTLTNDDYEKSTFKSTFPVPLDTTFSISPLETRSSLMLSSMDLIARFDNHFHRVEYSNSLLRQAKEDVEGKIEELDWKVQCFAREEQVHKSDMGKVLEKLKDIKTKLVNAEGENRGLKEKVKEGEGKEIKIGELEMEIAMARGEIDKLLDENNELRDKIDSLEEINQNHAFMKIFGDAESQISELREKIDGLETELIGTKGQLGGAEDENMGLKEKVEELETDLSNAREEILDVQRDKRDLVETMDENQQDMERYRGQIEYAKAEVESLRMQLESKDLELQHMREIIGEEKDAQSLDERIKNLQGELAALKAVSADLKSEAQDSEGPDTVVLEERIKALEEDNAKLEEVNYGLRAELNGFKDKAEELVEFGKAFPSLFKHERVMRESASAGNQMPKAGGYHSALYKNPQIEMIPA